MSMPSGKRPGQYRLPCRDRPPLLQRPLPARQGTSGCPLNRHHRGGPVQKQTGGQPCPELPQRELYHPHRTHAQEPSEISGVDPFQDHPLGREKRPQDQSAGHHILENRPHPEQGFRSCLGIMRLANQYSPERLETACTRALTIKTYSYKSVESILKNGLDQQPLLFDAPDHQPPAQHSNIRGKHYYH